jgi:hypothetical protein
MTAMVMGVSSLPRRRLVAGLLAWSGLGVTAFAQPVETDTPVTRVTSDSPEFCAQLADMLRQDVRTHQPAPVPDEVRMLGREGRKMCREGHIRPGILRIRRALLILRGEPVQLR